MLQNVHHKSYIYIYILNVCTDPLASGSERSSKLMAKYLRVEHAYILF